MKLHTYSVKYIAVYIIVQCKLQITAHYTLPLTVVQISGPKNWVELAVVEYVATAVYCQIIQVVQTNMKQCSMMRWENSQGENTHPALVFKPTLLSSQKWKVKFINLTMLSGFEQPCGQVG